MKQTRFIPIENCGLQLRESADGQPSRTVVGRPIMFGVRSVNLTPWSDTRVVYEILEPGCITQELINRSDVVYNNNHSNDIANMIGRCRNGKGTLTLALREQYVESECDYPNTTVANDTLEQIRLGNVYGMSFAFEDDWQDTENGVSYERTNETVDGKEVWLRHVKKIVALYDVANVTHPAYEQTSVGTREQSDRINEAIDAQLKRECGGGDDDDEDSIWYRMTISGNNQSEFNTIKAAFEKEGVRDNMTKKGDVTKNNAEVVTACKIAALKLENEVFTEGHAVNVTASVNNGNATTIYSVSFPATAPVTNE